MKPGITPLSQKERARYEICKKQIREGLQTCFDTGASLTEIKQLKYYREEFDTFEDFCAQTYQIGRSQAYRLIDAAEVKDSLPKSVSRLVTNEAQARALFEVPEGDRAKVILDVKKSGVPITADAIRDASPKPKMSPIGDTPRPMNTGKSEKSLAPEPVLDDIGTRIPFHAIPYWKRRQEIQDMLTTLSRIKSTVERAKKEGDCMFGKVSNCAIDNLSQSYTHLLEAKPFTVCTTCQGHFEAQPKGCSFCGNKGLISKWQWDVQVPREIKDLRLKANAKEAK